VLKLESRLTNWNKARAPSLSRQARTIAAPLFPNTGPRSLKKTKTKQQRFGRFLLAFTTPKFEHLDRGFYDVN